MLLNKVIIMPNCRAKCNPAAPAVLPLEAKPESLIFSPKASSFHSFTFFAYLQDRLSRDVRNCFDIHFGDQGLNVVRVNKEVLNDTTITPIRVTAILG